MKKLNIILSTFVFLLCFLINVAGANRWLSLDLHYDGKIHKYNAEQINITIDGATIFPNIEPISLSGRTYVPFRDVFEKLGGDVSWNAEKKQATVSKLKNTVVFTIDSNKIVKNNSEIIQIDTPAKIINDYTMVPIRAISQALEYDVSWENASRTVVIKSPTPPDTTPVNAEKIKILWDQTYPSMNDKEEKRQAINGLDVLSPTWFAIIDSNGTVEDKGSLDYAKWAKNMGYELWGLVSNSFDQTITKNVLSSPEKRSFVISQMLIYAKKYDLTGINIDFENIAKDDGDIYLQFIKDATPVFKANGLIVSVDMQVPTPWSKQYQMEEVGKIVDYIIIMAYDEHYRTSKISGSTASLPWCKKYMDEAIKLVPKNKLIMGIPFYTRLWSEKITPNGTAEVVESIPVTMEQVQNLIKDKDVDMVWLEDTKQHFIQYEEDGLIKKLWIEDEKSMEERMKLSKEYDLAGVAFWKRGYENNNIWDIINKYYK